MSEAPLLLAIDAGTGSCRAVLFDTEGLQVAIGQREYAHAEAPGVPGSQVFDTARNWALICECVREAIAGVGADRVAAVSATSMREGMVLYDARGREIWACPNVDARAGDEAAELVASGAAQEIYDVAGDWVAITAPARFLWIANHETDVFASIAHVGMLGDWILTKLSGAYVTDPSLGSSSGMFDLARRDWSECVLELVGLERDVFPDVVEPGTVVGAVAADAAAATGLRAGTPVVAGGADTQLGLVGIGVLDEGRFTVVGGTFWQQAVVLGEPLIDPQARLRTLCHTAPGRWMMEGIGFYCGLTMRWFRDAFCEAEKAEAARDGRDVYALLEERAAATTPGSNGLFGIFSNLMNASRWVHASPAFVGFDVASPERSGKNECFRAIEEAAAYVSLGHLRIARRSRGSPSTRWSSPAAPRRGRCGRRSSPTCSASPCKSPSSRNRPLSAPPSMPESEQACSRACGRSRESPASSEPSSPMSPLTWPTASCTSAGSTSTTAHSRSRRPASCVRSGARPEPEYERTPDA